MKQGQPQWLFMQTASSLLLFNTLLLTQAESLFQAPFMVKESMTLYLLYTQKYGALMYRLPLIRICFYH